jgi:hypothetical protein
MKSSTKKVESNIYVETRGVAMRFVVAVYPLPKDSGTFADHAKGLLVFLTTKSGRSWPSFRPKRRRQQCYLLC